MEMDCEPDTLSPRQPAALSGVPALTPEQMARVDRVMAEELGVDVLQLMELAGQAVAAFARERFLGAARGKRVAVLAGSGGNGGDGMVAARLLHAWGALPTVVLSHEPPALRGAAAHQLRSLTALGLPVLPPPAAEQPGALPDADLVIDALLGFGLSGPPSGASARLIAAANVHPAPVLAVDLPSGLDARSGQPYDPCLRADATLTLALPKTGLLAAAARPFVGDLFVADIGVPPAAYARLGVSVDPIFSAGGVVRVAGDW
jgi:NAD(P)H-hydrate epimerase